MPNRTEGRKPLKTHGSEPVAQNGFKESVAGVSHSFPDPAAAAVQGGRWQHPAGPSANHRNEPPP